MGNCSSGSNKNKIKTKNIGGSMASKDKESSDTKALPVKSPAPNQRPETSSSNHKQREYNVKIRLDGKDIHSQKYSGNVVLNEAYAKLLESHLNKNSDYGIFHAGADITIQGEATFDTLFNKYAASAEIVIELKYLGMNISNNFIESYSKCKLVGKPTFESDPLELTIFNTETNSLVNRYLSLEEHPNLKHFSFYTAYCNANNSIYISGGENTLEKDVEKRPMDSLYQIDLINNSIKELSPLKVARYWHSMIYIPDNYIFIVGGINTSSVEVYDINKNETQIDSLMKEYRGEPTLCCIDNTFLYAFFGFLYGHNYQSTIERCNLRKQQRIWEKIEFKINCSELNSRFFAVAYHSDNSVLFLGGNDINSESKIGAISQNYIFSHNDLSIDKFDNEYIEDHFNEKFFMPIDSKTSLIIPSDQLKVLICEEGRIQTMKFEENPETERMKSSRDAKGLLSNRFAGNKLAA